MLKASPHKTPRDQGPDPVHNLRRHARMWTSRHTRRTRDTRVQQTLRESSTRASSTLSNVIDGRPRSTRGSPSVSPQFIDSPRRRDIYGLCTTDWLAGTQTHEAKRSENRRSSFLSSSPSHGARTQAHKHTKQIRTGKIWAMKPAPCYDKTKGTPTPCDACKLKRNTDIEKGSIRWVPCFEAFVVDVDLGRRGFLSKPSQTNPSRSHSSPRVPESFVVPLMQPQSPPRRLTPAQSPRPSLP